MSSTEPSNELASLLSDLIDGTLCDEAHERLQSLLADADARAFYRDYMRLVAGIHWRWHSAIESPCAPQGAAPVPAPAEPAWTQRKKVAAPGGLRGLMRDFAREPVAVAILLLAMISGAVLAWQLSQVSPQPVAHQQPAPPPVVEFIARLTRSEGASWKEMKELADGTALTASQKLELKSGQVEIAFDSGATVILEGPAELQLGTRNAERGTQQAPDPRSTFHVSRSDNSCSLLLGKLVAHVPPQARGFAVATPTMMIVDQGTEFGVSVKSEVESPKVEVKAEARTEVHVFQGLVEVQSLLAQVPAQPIKSIELHAGEGVTNVTGDQPPRAIKADASGFVRALPDKPRLPLPTWPKDSPLQPGDIVAVTAKSMQVIKVDPKTGEQKLLAQGFAYNGEGHNHGVAWHCVAVSPDGHLLIGVDGLDGKEAGVLRIDPQTKAIQVVARGGLLTTGQISGLAVATDGTIYGVYQPSTPPGQPNHILKIDPKSGAVASLARMDRAHGLCMDQEHDDVVVTAIETGAVARYRAGVLTPLLSSAGSADRYSGAVGTDGRIFVTSSRTTDPQTREILEVGRRADHPPRLLATLPKSPDSNVCWNIALEASGSLIAGPAGQDRTMYRIDVEQGVVKPLSSGGMLTGNMAVAVVPAAPAPSGLAPQK